jgi:hypothetical protein
MTFVKSFLLLYNQSTLNDNTDKIDSEIKIALTDLFCNIKRLIQFFDSLKNKNTFKELQTIPGIGPSMARDLFDLGYAHIIELKWADPELMYQKLCELRGTHIDLCVLYEFRCAVYFASSKIHDPELLKWWNWKDGR